MQNGDKVRRVDLTSITFDTGSAAINPDQFDELIEIGQALQEILAARIYLVLPYQTAQTHGRPHTDFPFPHLVLLYYVNDADGNPIKAVYGPVLDGSLSGNNVIPDSDGGTLDGHSLVEHLAHQPQPGRGRRGRTGEAPPDAAVLVSVLSIVLWWVLPGEAAA